MTSPRHVDGGSGKEGRDVNRAQALAIRKERVKKARQWAEYTQQGLADAVTDMTGSKLTRQTVIDVEKGRIDLDTYLVEAIAEICGVSMDFMTGKVDTIELRRAKGVYATSLQSIGSAA